MAFSELIKSLAQGDDGAMAKLMERFGGAFHGYAKLLIGKVLQSQLDPEDVVQAVFLILWTGLRTRKFSVPTAQHFLALAKVLLRRQVARYARKINPPQDASMVDTVADQPLEAVCPDPTADQAVEFDDLVDQVLNQLQPLDRQLIQLRLHGFNTVEAARQLQLDPGSLRVRLGRLRQRFAQLRETIQATFPAKAPPDAPRADESAKVGAGLPTTVS